MRTLVTRNLPNTLFHHLLSPREFRSTPEGDSQPSQPGIKAKSFISHHKKSQSFSIERRTGSLCQENLVFGELAGEVSWETPSHWGGTKNAGCERAERLPTSCLRRGSLHWCRLLKVRTRKEKSFLEVRNCACLLDCTSQTGALWPGLTSNPPRKQSELALSQVICVQSEHYQQVARTMEKN